MAICDRAARQEIKRRRARGHWSKRDGVRGACSERYLHQVKRRGHAGRDEDDDRVDIFGKGDGHGVYGAADHRRHISSLTRRLDYFDSIRATGATAKLVVHQVHHPRLARSARSSYAALDDVLICIRACCSAADGDGTWMPAGDGSRIASGGGGTRRAARSCPNADPAS